MTIKYIDRQTGEVKTENPPAQGLLKFLYYNPFGKAAILPIAKQKFISEWYGRNMDKPSSVKKIQDFVDQLDIDMSESLKPISEFTSFNDFFYRELKPGVRPIGEGLVSPGDGRLIAFENVAELDNFFVKGKKFTLPEFLDDEQLAQEYENASLLILRLAPNDYHRFHFPYDGVPAEAVTIEGSYYSVSPLAVANNFSKVFSENKREYCTLKTEDKGDDLLAPVGATMVGSILETYTPDQTVRKGDEMGYFAFGGSSILMLIDQDRLKIDPDILQNTHDQLETLVRMGETIGQ
ncbi:MAG: phosphatidylserine decarboxylase [Cyclobacteriaceae bacterium]